MLKNGSSSGPVKWLPKIYRGGPVKNIAYILGDTKGLWFFRGIFLETKGLKCNTLCEALEMLLRGY